MNPFALPKDIPVYYSKIGSRQREISVDALNKIARYFGMTIDQIVNFDGTTPQKIITEDKTLMEQVKMIRELDPEERRRALKKYPSLKLVH